MFGIGIAEFAILIGIGLVFLVALAVVVAGFLILKKSNARSREKKAEK